MLFTIYCELTWTTTIYPKQNSSTRTTLLTSLCFFIHPLSVYAIINNNFRFFRFIEWREKIKENISCQRHRRNATIKFQLTMLARSEKNPNQVPSKIQTCKRLYIRTPYLSMKKNSIGKSVWKLHSLYVLRWKDAHDVQSEFIYFLSSECAIIFN